MWQEQPADWFEPSFTRVRDIGRGWALGSAWPRADKPKEYEQDPQYSNRTRYARLICV